ncbi:MAG: hypothetical protein ACOX6J_07290, partial [Oscillospiraceae bacterium]
SDNTAEIVFWDEDSSYSNYSGYVTATLEADGSEEGKLVSTSGTFFGSDFTQDGEWTFSLDNSSYGYDYSDLVIITATYTDPNDSSSGFTYVMVLRPWGTRWDNISDEDSVLLPYYLDEWYYPLIDSGASMPDQMDISA